MAAIELNEAQRTAVESDDPILCCACPGSGKTRVLIAKVRHILATHPDPRILMTTFSRDAAEEMLDRIRKERGLAREHLDRLTIGTFHSLALRQLKEAGRLSKVLSEIEVRHLVHRAVLDTGIERSLEEADAEIAHCKADKGYAAAHPHMARLTAAYQAHQQAVGGVDFTDLLLLANELMASKKIRPIQATHVLADEFQDIDRMQFDWLMHHLAQQPVLCAVGDDDQSIYGFRRSLGYKGMMDLVAATGARIVALDTNYRSQAGIVKAAGHLIACNLDRVHKNVKAARGQGPSPAVVLVPRASSQADWLVHALDRLCASNPVPKPLPGREPYRFGVKSGQAAVLARTNAQLHAVEAVFRNARVPYLRTGRSFWDLPLLQVYVAALDSLCRRDGMGLEIALRWAGLGDTLIRELADAASGSLWAYIDPDAPLNAPQTASPEFESLVRLGRGWSAKLSGTGAERAAQGVIYGVAAWMSNVMTRTCADDEDGHVRQGRGRREVRDLDRLEAARDALADAKGSLAVRLRRLQEQDSALIPRVILSTFHSAKGLEWDHVFLIDVYGGSVPKITAGDDMELAEERRLFYVAMTRARDSLTIFSRHDKPPSEFLGEAMLAQGSDVTANPVPETTDA